MEKEGDVVGGQETSRRNPLFASAAAKPHVTPYSRPRHRWSRRQISMSLLLLCLCYLRRYLSSKREKSRRRQSSPPGNVVSSAIESHRRLIAVKKKPSSTIPLI
ncbi:unnamed protein product [Linum trigynum]|uniref:Uncharacterized protein n=1 Tax=Linum trigynum TaxID=586398 RepID=A0AAV2FAG4_9ROSI